MYCGPSKQPGFETPKRLRVSNKGVGSSIERPRSLWAIIWSWLDEIILGTTVQKPWDGLIPNVNSNKQSPIMLGQSPAFMGPGAPCFGFKGKPPIVFRLGGRGVGGGSPKHTRDLNSKS